MTHPQADCRIVVGVDGSAASDAAVRWAIREALLRHATVHLVSAYHIDFRQRAQYVPWSRMTCQDERSAAAEALVTAAAELALRHLPRGRLMAELVDEPPARALLDRTADAEMLVLGTTRPAPQPGQPPQAMGPVARACLQLARCPVVVVSPDDRPVRDFTAGLGRAMADEPGESVVCPAPGGDLRDSPHRQEEGFFPALLALAGILPDDQGGGAVLRPEHRDGQPAGTWAPRR